MSFGTGTTKSFGMDGGMDGKRNRTTNNVIPGTFFTTTSSLCTVYTNLAVQLEFTLHFYGTYPCRKWSSSDTSCFVVSSGHPWPHVTPPTPMKMTMMMMPMRIPSFHFGPRSAIPMVPSLSHCHYFPQLVLRATTVLVVVSMLRPLGNMNYCKPFTSPAPIFCQTHHHWMNLPVVITQSLLLMRMVVTPPLPPRKVVVIVLHVPIYVVGWYPVYPRYCYDFKYHQCHPTMVVWWWNPTCGSMCVVSPTLPNAMSIWFKHNYHHRNHR